ncbi:hypothetical protein VP02_05265 [Pseudomonas ogarae]|uniref:Uncharacterized protein n=1 Tax=Pseudomonas kilonensis TaxID=132476 RepID=A0A0F4XTQ2_9PSED|nr:hypothetical protein [Pseudomonas ogarae]KKA09190.1 hypothetical protein VP02_05265 [Pseudomonas ogarae]OPG70586.1 hypothetical protein B1219_19985 [Pseudomonas ogarae]OPG81395.1 hypothetical protein B1218_00225 [Pseudomonas ogarae]PBJ13469.1 hypothetical protein BSF43_17480 [Pseudomonas ogarae]PBJ27016.1 hypothetical protein BSG18_01570 [Pseudomonas ogarae]
MNKPLKTITNPMTLIAIFATLSETSAAISLPFLDDQDREYYLWFLISFPFYLLLLFFITLNFNYRSLYSPSDFRKNKHFIKTMDDSPCRRKRQLRRADDVKELLVIRLHRRRREPDTLCIVCSQSKRPIETCRSRHLKQASIVVYVIYSNAGLATHGQDE